MTARSPGYLARADAEEKDRRRAPELLPALVSRNYVNRLHVYSTESGAYLCGRLATLDARIGWDGPTVEQIAGNQDAPAMAGYAACRQCRAAMAKTGGRA